VLARTFEAAGLSTVFVTMMPYFAERTGVPRTLAVEFPFGHALGHPGDREEQLRVIRAALAVLRDARTPGVIEHYPEPWAGDFDEWRKRWQPLEPSPIVRWLREQAERRAREQRQA
jgi:hypothetical protein